MNDSARAEAAPSTKFKVLKYREIEIPRYDGETRRFLVTIAAPPKTNLRALKESICNRFDTFCQHTYDCCGHWYTTAYTYTMRRTKSGEWTFVLCRSLNV